MIFFLPGFSFTNTGDSQDSRGKERTIFYSTLPLLPAHKHSVIYLQLCMLDASWDLHYWITIWLIHDAMLVCLFDDLILCFCYSNLTRETSGFELISTITHVLQSNQLTKCASNPNNKVNVRDHCWVAVAIEDMCKDKIVVFTPAHKNKLVVIFSKLFRPYNPLSGKDKIYVSYLHVTHCLLPVIKYSRSCWVLLLVQSFQCTSLALFFHGYKDFDHNENNFICFKSIQLAGKYFVELTLPATYSCNITRNITRSTRVILNSTYSYTLDSWMFKGI